MKTIKSLLGGSLLALAVLTQPAQAADAIKPIHFGDITWESGSLITEVLRLIVEKGYGLPTDTLPGSTVSLENPGRRQQPAPHWHPLDACAFGDWRVGAVQGAIPAVGHLL